MPLRATTNSLNNARGPLPADIIQEIAKLVACDPLVGQQTLGALACTSKFIREATSRLTFRSQVFLGTFGPKRAQHIRRLVGLTQSVDQPPFPTNPYITDTNLLVIDTRYKFVGNLGAMKGLCQFNKIKKLVLSSERTLDPMQLESLRQELVPEEDHEEQESPAWGQEGLGERSRELAGAEEVVSDEDAEGRKASDKVISYVTSLPHRQLKSFVLSRTTPPDFAKLWDSENLQVFANLTHLCLDHVPGVGEYELRSCGVLQKLPQLAHLELAFEHAHRGGDRPLPFPFVRETPPRDSSNTSSQSTADSTPDTHPPSPLPPASQTGLRLKTLALHGFDPNKTWPPSYHRSFEPHSVQEEKYQDQFTTLHRLEITAIPLNNPLGTVPDEIWDGLVTSGALNISEIVIDPVLLPGADYYIEHAYPPTPPPSGDERTLHVFDASRSAHDEVAAFVFAGDRSSYRLPHRLPRSQKHFQRLQDTDRRIHKAMLKVLKLLKEGRPSGDSSSKGGLRQLGLPPTRDCLWEPSRDENDQVWSDVFLGFGKTLEVLRLSMRSPDDCLQWPAEDRVWDRSELKEYEIEKKFRQSYTEASQTREEIPNTPQGKKNVQKSMKTLIQRCAQNIPNLKLLDIRCIDFAMSNAERREHDPRPCYVYPAFPQHRYRDGKKEDHPDVKQELIDAASKDVFTQIRHRVHSERWYGFTVKVNDRIYKAGKTWEADGKRYCRFEADTEYVSSDGGSP